MAGVELASLCFPGLQIVVIIYNIGNLIFDIFSKQYNKKI